MFTVYDIFPMKKREKSLWRWFLFQIVECPHSPSPSS